MLDLSGDGLFVLIVIVALAAICLVLIGITTTTQSKLKKQNELNRNLQKLMKDKIAKLEFENDSNATIFTAISDPIFIKDPQGRLIWFNRSFEKMMGLSHDSIYNRTVAQLLGSNVEDAEFGAISSREKEVLESKQPMSIEEMLYVPSIDSYRLFEISKAPVVRQGSIAGILSIAHDVTERKATEEAARAASVAKSDFLSRISHEIRTPLNAIIGMTSIAQSAQNNQDKVNKSLVHISSASAHLLELINDVLDMSKIESGKFEIVVGPFELQGLRDEVISIIGQRCKDKMIDFSNKTNLSDDLFLNGDKLHIKQVLINLLGNAVKFTGNNGRILFAIETTKDDETTTQIKFTVKDNGIGMTKEQTSRLFTAFEQTDSKIAQKYGGTGLGLAISQKLVQMMGGEIVVTSTLGKGTSFEFELAFEKAASVERAQVFETPKELNLSGSRILLVDDVEINRLIAMELLSFTNLEFVEATTGEEAVAEFVKSEPGYFDMILMDVQMPVMDGYEATSTIRKLDRPDASTIPIIAMTANAYQKDINAALASGMNGHLSKPVDFKLLIKIISEFLVGA